MYLFVHEDREHLLSPGERFESDLGILEVPADVAPGDVVETHLGNGFTVRRLRGRGPLSICRNDSIRISR